MKPETRDTLDKFMIRWCALLPDSRDRQAFIEDFTRVCGLYGKDVGDEVYAMVQASMPILKA